MVVTLIVLLIFLLRMYFKDSADLQAHLNDDWSILLHNLKARQELLHQLLVYNHRIIRQRLQEDELFTNDQILNHHTRITNATQANALLDAEEQPLLAKYEGTIVSWEGVVKLMQRVGARVLETFQLSLEQCKSLDEELVEKHARMKQNLIKLLNQRENIDLQAIGSLVVSFSRNNLLYEIDRLKKIVEALESGELDKLSQVYDFRAKRVSLQMLVEKQKKSVEKAKNGSLGREDRSTIREQIRKQDKIKKQKQKVATKLVNGLYSMLQLSRQQFMDDICCTEREKATRLYNQIFSRNRLNHLQILAFEAKKDEFLQKLKLFKEMMERESAKIAQTLALTIKVPLRRRQKEAEVEVETASVGAPSDLLIEEIGQQEPVTQRKIVNNRYRIQSPKQKREVREFLSSFSNVMPASRQNFNHFKFDTSNQEIYARSNRNRLPLPVISQNGNSRCVNRATSLDQRVQLNKSKINRKMEKEDVDNEQMRTRDMLGEKEDRYMAHRAKFAMKNVEIGVQQRAKRNSKQSKKIEKIEPHPMEYTFYVRKSNKRLYDTRLNAFL